MTIQFETKIVNGQISVPIQYVEKLSSSIKVILVSLYENSEDNVSVK